MSRFSEPALLVLISLADGAKYGYAMHTDIGELTGERPGPGTLYGTIRRQAEQGLIVSSPSRIVGSRIG